MPAACALMLLPALAGPGEALHAASKPYRITAVKETARKRYEPVETLTAVRDGVTFAIRYLDPASARRAVADTVGRDLHLIRARDEDRDPGHLVFLVQVDNGTGKTVRFNPGEAWLHTNKGDMKIPLDYSALFMLGQRLGDRAPTTDEVAEVFFDREVTLAPGGSVRKLLVFDAPREDKYKSFEIRIAEVNVAADPIGFVFPFRKIREE